LIGKTHTTKNVWFKGLHLHSPVILNHQNTLKPDTPRSNSKDRRNGTWATLQHITTSC